MANIVFESKYECWCSDCGSIGDINCWCEPCLECGEYSTDLIYNEKKDISICENCLEEQKEKRRGRK